LLTNISLFIFSPGYEGVYTRLISPKTLYEYENNLRYRFSHQVHPSRNIRIFITLDNTDTIYIQK